MARLRVLDSSGAVSLRRDVPDTVTVSADPASGRVGYLDGQRLQQTDPRTGADLPAVSSVRAARYDGAGSVFVVRADNTVEWLPVTA
jgi:hypothetical protein